MALLDIVKKGSTSRSVELYVFDNTTGLPKTGLTYASSGIDLWYRRERSAVTSITEVTIAGLTTAFTSGSFIEVANGWYSLDIPDAALATSANWVLVGGTLTGYTVVGGTIKLVDYDPEDTVRMGLTGLANAVPGAAGGLVIAGTNAATTFTSAAGAGLTIASTGTNGHGLAISGNGSGAGISATGGATGFGIIGTGGATSGSGARFIAQNGNGSGLQLFGDGTAPGLTSTGGATGHGAHFTGGATSGNGIKAQSAAGNSPGVNFVGQGSGEGLVATGGTTGHGISGVGGGSSGKGFYITSDAAAVTGALLSSGVNAGQIEVANGDVLVVAAVSGAVASVTGAVGSVTGNVGGNVNGSVASVTTVSAGAITAASLAADTITAAKVAADVSTEIVTTLNATVMESNGSITFKQGQQYMISALAGTSDGAGVFKTPDGVATRITATLSSNARTAVTLNSA